MGWKSSDVVTFGLEPLLQGQRGQPYLKVLITSLLLILEVCNVNPTYSKSWASNLLLWSDLTFGLSFKVKQWFTDFSELFFRWIQFCIGSLMRRSSCKYCYNGLFCFELIYLKSLLQITLIGLLEKGCMMQVMLYKLCYKIYQVHSRPNFQGRKGFSH